MNDMSRLIRFGFEESERPYYPYPVAAEKGIVPAGDTELAAAPGTEILNGRIPNAKRAGMVSLGDETGAFDLTRGEMEGSRLLISSASKNRVNGDGKISGEGIVVLSESSGRLRIAAFALDALKHYWMIQKLNERHLVGGRVGPIAMIGTGFELPDFEIKDVDSREGIVTAKPRQPIFSFGG